MKIVDIYSKDTYFYDIIIYGDGIMRKKKNIILGVLVCILVILVCTLLFVIGKKYNPSKSDYESILNIDLAGFKEKVEKKEKFVLVVTQTGCSHCMAYLPVLEEVGKEYKLTFYDINMTDLSDEDRTEFNKLVRISGTPTTLFYTDGEETSTTTRLVGQKTKDKIISRLKSEGYINE